MDWSFFILWSLLDYNFFPSLDQSLNSFYIHLLINQASIGILKCHSVYQSIYPTFHPLMNYHLFYPPIIQNAINLSTHSHHHSSFINKSMNQSLIDKLANISSITYPHLAFFTSTDISMDIPVSITTIYFAFLAAMFMLTALLHPKELYCLFHFLWYLLCLPSAYLILMIYSICNLTDSSWGMLGIVAVSFMNQYSK